MNRAVHLSRPDPTSSDLRATAVGIAEAMPASVVDVGLLEAVTHAYVDFQQRALRTEAPHFHGLRDFYSLVKVIAGSLDGSDDEVVTAVYRNFGGLANSAQLFEQLLRDRGGVLGAACERPVTDLIRANLIDPHARHLMLITSGDSAIGLLQSCFPAELRQPLILVGSEFEAECVIAVCSYSLASSANDACCFHHQQPEPGLHL